MANVKKLGLFDRLFAEEMDPIKELIKTGTKKNSTCCSPTNESVGDLFTIGKKLGEGAFGAVYSAVRNSDKKLVALKYMNARSITCWWDTEGEAEGTPMEIHVHGKVRNIPGAIALLDVYRTNGSGGYVLVLDQPSPCITDLQKYARDKFAPIDDKLARNIVFQVINILRQVHNAGVYHQDVKHENLLIQPKTGKVHLIDFGAALLVKHEPYSSFYGTDVCKPVEMLTSGSCRAEPSTVWSVGILAFRLMTHRFPFYNDEEIQAGKLNFTEHCTTDLRDFVMACFNKDPLERPTLVQLFEHPWLTQG